MRIYFSTRVLNMKECDRVKLQPTIKPILLRDTMHYFIVVNT